MGQCVECLIAGGGKRRFVDVSEEKKKGEAVYGFFHGGRKRDEMCWCFRELG